MRALILLSAIWVVSLATHADAIDDTAEAGGKLMVQYSNHLNYAYGYKQRDTCSESPRAKDACLPDEAKEHQLARNFKAQAEQLAPTHAGINFSRDQKSLSADDLMWELINRVQGRLENEESLRVCKKVFINPQSCTKEQKNVDFYKSTYAETKAFLENKGGNTIFAKKDATKSDKRLAETLEELKDQNLAQGSFLPFGPLDPQSGSAHYRNGSCDFKLVGVSFEDYKAVWTSDNLSWKAGAFTRIPSRGGDDDQYSKAMTKCQALDTEVHQKTCRDVLVASGSFLGSGYVILTSVPEGKSLVVSSKGGESGIFECLKINGFAIPFIQDSSKKVAGEGDKLGQPAARR